VALRDWRDARDPCPVRDSTAREGLKAVPKGPRLLEPKCAFRCAIGLEIAHFVT
jgi:hypothetical protein